MKDRVASSKIVSGDTADLIFATVAPRKFGEAYTAESMACRWCGDAEMWGMTVVEGRINSEGGDMAKGMISGGF